MPGESARREYERRRVRDAAGRRPAGCQLPLHGVVFVAVVAYFMGETPWPGNGGTLAPVAGVVAALSMAVALGPKRSTTAWRTGADGASQTLLIA